MRALTVLLLLSIAAPANAQVRTWTIARDVYTVEGDLLAVRGDMAYVKVGDKVESIPLARLSAADQEYIGSLALAPVTPGPMGDETDSASLGGPMIPNPAGDVRPIPGIERSLVVPAASSVPIGPPEVNAAVAEEMLPHPPGQPPQPPQASTSGYGNTWPRAVPPTNAPQRDSGNASDRRYRRQQSQQQQPNNRASNSQRDNDDEPRGLFRARRRQ